MSLIRTLRERAGLTQSELAERVGTAQAQIARLEGRKRRMTVEWAMKLAPHLNVDPSELMDAGQKLLPLHEDREQRDNKWKAIAAWMGSDQDNIPVYSMIFHTSNHDSTIEDEPINRTEKPSYLRNARDSYAIWVAGESMLPRYRPSQVIFIHPTKPPAAGAGIVVRMRSGSVFIREYVRHEADGLVVKEYYPELRETTIPHAEIEAIHTVAGLQEP